MTRRPALLLLVLLVSAGTALTAVAPAQATRPGTLTSLGCFGDDLPGGMPSNTHHCEEGALGTAGHELLDGAGVPLVSADGKHVYLTSYSSAAVVWFDRGAGGALTPAGCVADVPAPVGCAEAQGLASPWGIDVSPDGKQLYVAGGGDDAVVRLDVATDGSLSDGGCVSGPEGPCATKADGLAGAYGVAVAPDGGDVYVTGFDDAALVQLGRSASGALTAGTCLQLAPAGPECTAAPGLGSPWLPDVSPDGRSVYVPSSDGAVAILDRTPATGALSGARCIRDAQAVVAGCTATAPSIGGAYDLDVSPDGRSVYVAGNTDNAVTLLRRAADGDLTNGGCVQDRAAGQACATETEGLNQVAYVVVAPDGDQVLTGSVGDNAVTTFDRNADTTLTGRSCIEDADDSEATCATSGEGLNGSFALALSPDGRNVYVGGYSDDALAMLARKLVRPGFTLVTAKRPNVLALKTRLTCDSRCSVTVKGQVTVRVTKVVGGKRTVSVRRFATVPYAVSLLPGRSVTPRLRVKQGATVRRLLLDGATARARLVGVAVNTGGRTTVVRRAQLRS